MTTVDLAPLIEHRDLLASGLLVTVGVSIIGIVAGLLLAVPLALMKLSRKSWFRWCASAAVEALRNAPFIVLLVLVHFGAPKLLARLQPWQSGIVALSLYGAAYFTEVLRGGFSTVPPGQIEAARALGLKRGQTLLKVTAPQMVAAVVPPARVIAVMLIKESAVLSIIAVPELTHAALRIQAETFDTVEVFGALAMLYWLLTLAVGGGGGPPPPPPPRAHRLAAATRTRRRATMRGSAVATRYLTLDWRPR